MTETNTCFSMNSAIQKSTMYAIAFDLDQDRLKAAYPGASPNNAYKEIEVILGAHHFSRQQGSVYFGDMEKVNVVSCVMAIIDLATKCCWLADSVSDIRMLRIEDNNDLMPIVRHTAGTLPKSMLKAVPSE